MVNKKSQNINCFIEYKKNYITFNITNASIDALRCSSASKLNVFKYMNLLCQKLTKLVNIYCEFNTLN